MPHSEFTYQKKFNSIVQQTSFGLLSVQEKEFLQAKSFEMHFTLQELRQVSEIALDRMRWKESPLSQNWPQDSVSTDIRYAKKRILTKVYNQYEKLKANENSYGQFSEADQPVTRKPILKIQTQDKLGLGRCPVASEKTRCCNLMTLDAVQKCGFDCSYCSIQSFYHGNEVVFDAGFAGKLAKLELDPDIIYHIGTGQSSDSLMWGNHQGVLEALCQFANDNPNVILELKTKSKNIGWLLKNPIPRNIICTWSLNPQMIIDHEEHLSASLEDRLRSAEAIASKGGVVGFHFHPVVHFSGWETAYRDIAKSLLTRFNSEQIAMISLGTLTFTRAVMKTIRNRPLYSKILQMPLEECAGKFSYPVEIKVPMFKLIYDALEDWQKSVFFYLCMESHELWTPVFGYQYTSNEELEYAMKSAYMHKINL